MAISGLTPPSLSDPANFNDDAVAFLAALAALDSADFFNVQSSNYDDADGKVLTVGAFGLGKLAGLNNVGDLNDYTVASGVWGVFDTTTNVASRPSGCGNFGVVRIDRYDENNILQTIWDTSFGGDVWMRQYAGSWGSWYRILTLNTSGHAALNGTKIGGQTLTIADDAATALTQPSTAGHVLITCQGNARYSGIAFFDTGTPSGHKVGTSGADFLVTVGSTGTGTTGTDGDVHLYVASGGITLENRSGASRTFFINYLGR